MQGEKRKEVVDIRVVREFLSRFHGDRDITCPHDLYDMLPNLNHNDTIELYCLACNYRVEVGYSLYDRMKRAVLEPDQRP